MSGTCSGCRTSFARLNGHLDVCSKYQALLNGGLKRRTEDAQAAHEAEARRIEHKRLLEAEHMQRMVEEREQQEVRIYALFSVAHMLIFL